MLAGQRLDIDVLPVGISSSLNYTVNAIGVAIISHLGITDAKLTFANNTQFRCI